MIYHIILIYLKLILSSCINLFIKNIFFIINFKICDLTIICYFFIFFNLRLFKIPYIIFKKT